MIGRLNGMLVEKRMPHLMLEVSGVGYELQASMTTFSHLPEVGCTVVLYTHLVIREDAHQLYGFFEYEERELFRHLIKVNGIGPKIALTLLSNIEPSYFIQCIIEGETASLIRIPGIGKKTAERLVIEMRDKLAGGLESGAVPANTMLRTKENSPLQDAISALVTLGYRPQDAVRVLSHVNTEGQKAEDLVRQGLKELLAS